MHLAISRVVRRRLPNGWPQLPATPHAPFTHLLKTRAHGHQPCRLPRRLHLAIQTPPGRPAAAVPAVPSEQPLTQRAQMTQPLQVWGLRAAVQVWGRRRVWRAQRRTRRRSGTLHWHRPTAPASHMQHDECHLYRWVPGVNLILPQTILDKLTPCQCSSHVPSIARPACPPAPCLVSTQPTFQSLPPQPTPDLPSTPPFIPRTHLQGPRRGQLWLQHCHAAGTRRLCQGSRQRCQGHRARLIKVGYSPHLERLLSQHYNAIPVDQAL